MYTSLTDYIQSLEREFQDIPRNRKLKLQKIADYIRKQHAVEQPAKLTFICTHNSRRSHLCQIWSAVAAVWYNIAHVQTYSGGTEATAFNPRAVSALERVGFKIDNPGGDNPHYQVFYDDDSEPLECYSKIFDDTSNPQQDFAAVMTCSEADANCPFIPGAKARISLPYNDPKEADNTPDESRIYNERCRQIAKEMFYLINLVKK